MSVIIDRYIGRELLKTLIGVSIVLYFIFLSNKLVRYLAEVASGELPGSYLLIILGLASMRYLVIFTPLAFYISILLLFGRLYRDHEMASLSACGIGMGRLYRPVFNVAIPLTILIAVLSFYVVPWASSVQGDLSKLFARNLEFTGISPGKFHASGNRIIYLEKMSEDKTNMEKVFIKVKYDDREILMMAEKAYLEVDPNTDERLLVMINGSRYEGMPGESDFKQLKFSRHAMRVAPSKKKVAYTSVESLSTMALIQSGTIKAWAELQWRAAIPLSTLVLAFLAVPLSKINPRQGQFGKLFSGILLYIVYVNLIAVSKAWMVKETLSLSVGMTWVHLLVILLTLIILLREHGWFWVRRLWFSRLRNKTV
ncbi:MAG: LPS export ABC transporter permease LptF [Gammaproteobacteria bacterium]|nr:LPS export ABC transporter permease LptF [Gammaproteobacteria bacterium]